ncbi:MAG: hypothetical protein HQM16_19390 [Deltaproteobacteria bacterium]|nr:hypothetical protein [Deltaproteobacteria bacterium]
MIEEEGAEILMSGFQKPVLTASSSIFSFFVSFIGSGLVIVVTGTADSSCFL